MKTVIPMFESTDYKSDSKSDYQVTTIGHLTFVKEHRLLGDFDASLGLLGDFDEHMIFLSSSKLCCVTFHPAVSHYSNDSFLTHIFFSNAHLSFQR